MISHSTANNNLHFNKSGSNIIENQEMLSIFNTTDNTIFNLGYIGLES